MSVIRRPIATELEFLTGLCLRSKAYWGCDDAFLEACRPELTLSRRDLRSTALAVLETNSKLVGVVQVEFLPGAISDLSKLFVEPTAIGRGYGRRLFEWAACEGQRRGARCMTIEADPGAEPFYRRMGATPIGAAPSRSIPGRTLPLLKLQLQRAAG